MKHHFLILFFIIVSSQFLYTQELEKKTLYSLEVMISLNRTTVADENTHNRFGFGAGLYYPFFDQKRCNLVVGLEYNKNNMFFEYISAGKYSTKYNTTYNINNIGIPVCFRVNMGKKVFFFVEAGTFVDFAISRREKGMYHIIYFPYTTNSEMPDRPFDNKISFRTPDFGLQGGIGLRIPIHQKYEILIKGDYKWCITNLINNYYDSIRNKYWRFSVGFKTSFNLKKKKIYA